RGRVAFIVADRQKISTAGQPHGPTATIHSKRYFYLFVNNLYAPHSAGNLNEFAEVCADVRAVGRAIFERAVGAQSVVAALRIDEFELSASGRAHISRSVVPRVAADDRVGADCRAAQGQV